MRSSGRSMLSYLVLLPVLVLVQLPLLWMVLTAFKRKGFGLSMVFSPTVELNGERVPLYTTENFRAVLFDPSFPFWQFALNSLIVAGGCAFLTVLLCSMAGYG